MKYTRAVKQKEHQHYADTLIDTLLKPCVPKQLILLGFCKLATGIEPVTSSLPMKCATDCAMPACRLSDKKEYSILYIQLQQFL